MTVSYHYERATSLAKPVATYSGCAAAMLIIVALATWRVMRRTDRDQLWIRPMHGQTGA
jgi:hypothetical protein